MMPTSDHPIRVEFLLGRQYRRDQPETTLSWQELIKNQSSNYVKGSATLPHGLDESEIPMIPRCYF